MGWPVRVALAGLCGLALTRPCLAQGAGAGQIVRMTPQECIARALSVSPDVEQAKLAVSALEAKLSEARFAGVLPQFQLTNFFGPVPGVKGNLDSLETIRSDLSNLGVFSRTTLDLVQPLYTFGRLSAVQEAARYGLQAGEAGVSRKKNDIVLQVERLCYGLLLAKALLSVVEEAQENIQKARTKVNQLLEEGSEDASENDLRKIEVFEYEVKRNTERAQKAIELGKAALKMTLKLDRQADFDITTSDLEPAPVTLSDLGVYIDRAYASRPDIKQLRAGVQARRSLLRVTRSEYFPQIALVGSLQYGAAPNRPHFSNPFLRDEFNFFRLGALVTLRQSFSFGLTSARYRASQAEYFDLASKEEQARNAVALEVEQAYRDVQEADHNVQNSERAMRAAKTWLTSAAIGYDISGETADLMNAFTAYSRMRQEYYQSVFNLNVALAVLDHVTGRAASN
ncbi:MAG: TolC family protein [Candidatus Latescibacteria bacterium]|nr:TolC family protein [Candidatus Latescibacterota bacterium]